MKSAKADLVVRSLDVEDHFLLEDRVLARCEQRGLVNVDTDGVTDVVAPIVRYAGVASGRDANIEDLGGATAGTRGADHCIFGDFERAVVIAGASARVSQRERPGDVAFVTLVL